MCHGVLVRLHNLVLVLRVIIVIVRRIVWMMNMVMITFVSSIRITSQCRCSRGIIHASVGMKGIVIRL